MSEAGAASATPFAVEFRGLSKRFGNVVANDDVSFGVRSGSIHGIIGENGAGKSTLMSALFGLYRPDAGEILLDGRPSDIRGPSTAIQAGVGMVHQHFMLVERMTALQNVVLGAEDGAWLRGGTGDVRARVQAIQDRYGLRFPLNAVTRDLPVGVQQRVEILKALYRGARVLILDEPTSVLTPPEVEQLFQVFHDLKAQGKTVILITHKLQEVLAVTDTVTVLRAGRAVETRPTAGADRTMLATLMVGRKPRPLPDARAAVRPEVRLEAENLVVADRAGVRRVSGLSFEVQAGEVLGVAGVSGNGQSELLAALAGLAPLAAGRARIGTVEIASDRPATPEAVRRGGVGHVPEDRQRLGMIKGWDAIENSVLGLHRTGGIAGVGWRISRRAIAAWCGALMEAHDVRPRDPSRRLGLFSGGNQQKLVFGRELALSPDVLLVGQPTRGVDIGAIESIHAALLAERDKGTAILLVSVELEEILALSDRILVMFEGRSMGLLDRAEADERLLGLMMAGLPLDEARREAQSREAS